MSCALRVKLQHVAKVVELEVTLDSQTFLVKVMAFFMLMFGCALVIQNRTEVLIYYGGSDLLVLQYFYTAVVYRCSEWLEGGMFCDDKRAGVAFT